MANGCTGQPQEETLSGAFNRALSASVGRILANSCCKPALANLSIWDRDFYPGLCNTNLDQPSRSYRRCPKKLLVPNSVDVSLEAGAPKRMPSGATAVMEPLPTKQVDIMAKILPLRATPQHMQISAAHQPQQKKRRQIKISGFITSAEWLREWERIEETQTKKGSSGVQTGPQAWLWQAQGV
eukprot:356968-Chlamydomonas_euryale.AAC.31